jgi:hypothetical protein
MAARSQKRTGRPSNLRLPQTPPPAERLAKAAFARWLGCSKSRLTEWCQNGTLSEPALTPDGLIVPERAVQQLTAAGKFVGVAVSAALAVAKVADADGPRPLSYDEAKTATETLRAHRELLELRQRRAELAETATAEAILFAATRGFRDAMVTWPVRIVPEMAAKLGVAPAKLLAELNGAVRDFLTTLADPKADWRKGLHR